MRPHGHHSLESGGRRSAQSGKAGPLSEREKVLVALLALTWVSIPLLLMHAGLESHSPRHERLLAARRDPADEPAAVPRDAAVVATAPKLVDTSTTSLYHLFSVPVLASLEPLPKADLDEVARIVLEKYHSLDGNKISGESRETGHLEQLNNDFFSWQNDVGARSRPPARVAPPLVRAEAALPTGGLPPFRSSRADGGWVRARWNCRDREAREHGKSWEDRETIAFCDEEVRAFQLTTFSVS